MTTITIDRELLEQALVALSAPNHCVFSEPPICVDIRAALAAPATAQAGALWCPMVRHTTNGEDITCNRVGVLPNEIHLWNSCIASRCAMWRVVEGALGYCGLAPLHRAPGP